MDSETPDDVPDLPEGASGGRTLRVLLDAASGAIPLAGGVLSAAAGAWSERDQERINDFLKHWIEMLLAEMKEKRQTILEITARSTCTTRRLPSASRAPNISDATQGLSGLGGHRKRGEAQVGAQLALERRKRVVCER